MERLYNGYLKTGELPPGYTEIGEGSVGPKGIVGPEGDDADFLRFGLYPTSGSPIKVRDFLLVSRKNIDDEMEGLLVIGIFSDGVPQISLGVLAHLPLDERGFMAVLFHPFNLPVNMKFDTAHRSFEIDVRNRHPMKRHSILVAYSKEP